MLEQCLIDYCAPTLAGIKCAGLFNYFFEDSLDAKTSIDRMNANLNNKGITMTVLNVVNNRALIFVYRKKCLEHILNDQQARSILKKFNYPLDNYEEMLQYLKLRVQTAETFPHEIGIFLGYPLEDVECFIKYKGQHSKYSGMWKVYGDVNERKQLFAQFDECTSIYQKGFAKTNDFNRFVVSLT